MNAKPKLDNELVLKWLHHMGELAKEAGAREGRTVNVTDHGGKIVSTDHAVTR